MQELCKICAEYDHNLTKIKILKGEIKACKQYPHLKWAVDRDTASLNRLVNRQAEIKDIITSNNTITFKPQ